VAVLATGAAWWGFTLWSDTGHVSTIPVQAAPVVAAPQPNRADPMPPPAQQAATPATSPDAAVPRPTGIQGAQPTSGLDGNRTPKPVGSQPLDLPLPTVTGILISSDRQFAVIDGAVVSAGDKVGPRVVVRIEPAAVILREPSGHEVRVPVRPKG
jgi:hypothetical protein